jgi:HEAT repeat protein/cyclophilin family peptidyl-prolyl cis-trans isomerase
MYHTNMSVPARLVGVAALAISAACASVPVAPPPPPPPIVTLDQKVAWILRLEQQRVLADADASPAVPVPAPAPTARAARPGPAPPAVVDAPAFRAATAPDLTALAADPDALVRRRAVIAIGRVGLADGVPLLVTALQDPDEEVRASAAFGLGLLGATEPTDPPETVAATAQAFPGTTALLAALQDPLPQVQARAIEALGLIGDPSAAGAIVQAAAGCAPRLAAIAPDDEEWPKAWELEVCRLALFALVRLQDYGAIAAVALDPSGRPVSRWWPVAYALQRSNDPRAAAALHTIAAGPGLYSVGFALRGLTSLKDPNVAARATALVTETDADVKLRVAAVRALGTTRTTAPLRELLLSAAVSLPLQLEVVMALGVAGDREAFDLLLDLLTHESPAMRAAALRAAARTNPDAFLIVLSGLGRDPDWSVRAALAEVLATLSPEVVTGAIESLTEDPDVRVHGPALDALAAVKAPSLTSRLFAALETADFVVRATAARLIGETRPEGGVPRLVAAYTRGESDVTYVARWAAVEALSKYGGEPAVATLRQALADRDWPVRWRAARVLARLGHADARPERPAPLSRPAEFFASDRLLHPQYSPRALIETRQGVIEVQLNVVEAAVTAQIFIDQVRTGFFNGMAIHRVVPTFVVQTGDQRGDGEGGPGYTMRDELSGVPYLRGTMGMALDWRETGGSQWFIALSPQPHLDGRYTVFGRVVTGLEVLDRLAPWDVIDRIRIWDGVTLQ